MQHSFRATDPDIVRTVVLPDIKSRDSSCNNCFNSHSTPHIQFQKLFHCNLLNLLLILKSIHLTHFQNEDLSARDPLPGWRSRRLSGPRPSPRAAREARCNFRRDMVRNRLRRIVCHVDQIRRWNIVFRPQVWEFLRCPH